jgi:hypothetical protein
MVDTLYAHDGKWTSKDGLEVRKLVVYSRLRWNPNRTGSHTYLGPECVRPAALKYYLLQLLHIDRFTLTHETM